MMLTVSDDLNGNTSHSEFLLVSHYVEQCAVVHTADSCAVMNTDKIQIKSFNSTLKCITNQYIFWHASHFTGKKSTA